MGPGVALLVYNSRAVSLLEGEEGDQLLWNFPKRLCEKAAATASKVYVVVVCTKKKCVLDT